MSNAWRVAGWTQWVCLVAGMAALASSPLAQTVDTDSAADPIVAAAEDFQAYCGPCHGTEGRGDGPVAVELVTPPADLTKLAKRAGGTFPAAVVHKTIDGRNMPSAHGTQEMPVWGYWFGEEATAGGLLQEDRDTAEKIVQQRIDRLVEYIETLQEQ